MLQNVVTTRHTDGTYQGGLITDDVCHSATAAEFNISIVSRKH